MQKILTFVCLFTVFLSSCKQFEAVENNSGLVDVSQKKMTELTIPEGFTFETTQDLDVQITAVDNQGKIMKNIPFRVYLRNKNSADSALVMEGMTDDNGFFLGTIPASVNTGTLILETDYIGLPSLMRIPVTSNRLSITMGADNRRQSFSSEDGAGTAGLGAGGAGTESTPWTYMGSYNNSGVPSYLTTRDIVNQDILRMINVSLPEARAVPTFNPQYINEGVRANFNVLEMSDVWITFVHEGAAYRNAVGFYSYPKNNPPRTINDVTDLKIIFPNASYFNSGGGLYTGDKVYLGRFPANTSIGWFLVPDGWTGSQVSVKNGRPTRYSNKELNTFSATPYASHSVVLADRNRELLVVGIEDQNRPNGDSDFNDAVFYVTANPFTALEINDMPAPRVYAVDTDRDGVPDVNDVAPRDPSYSAVSHFPSATGYSSVAFEDSWPVLGDFDMNDFVADYNVQERMNAAGKITQIRYKVKVKALGAGFKNGFGIELPVPANKVASVTGAQLTEGYITRSANGTESGQTNAVIIALDNAHKFMYNATGFVNTDPTGRKVDPKEIELVVTFNDPVRKVDLGTAPYNPFLIVNGERGREVHLAGKRPTALADQSLFNKGADFTRPANGKFYQSRTGLPWAIQLPEPFEYPVEKVAINATYTKFNEWVQSNGVQSPNWYQNLSGFRLASSIFR